MNGTLVAVMVEEGQSVKAGDTLMVMEAMKMEYLIQADAAGQIRELYCKVGDLVDGGASLLELV